MHILSPKVLNWRTFTWFLRWHASSSINSLFRNVTSGNCQFQVKHVKGLCAMALLGKNKRLHIVLYNITIGKDRSVLMIQWSNNTKSTTLRLAYSPATNVTSSAPRRLPSFSCQWPHGLYSTILPTYHVLLYLINLTIFTCISTCILTSLSHGNKMIHLAS